MRAMTRRPTSLCLVNRPSTHAASSTNGFFSLFSGLWPQIKMLVKSGLIKEGGLELKSDGCFHSQCSPAVTLVRPPAFRAAASSDHLKTARSCPVNLPGFYLSSYPHWQFLCNTAAI